MGKRGVLFMYMTVKQAAEKWGISDRRVRISCAERKVSGVIRERRRWMIPVDTRKPSIIDPFMEAYDFGKKMVIPFATSGESPIDDIGKNIQLLEPRNSSGWKKA